MTVAPIRSWMTQFVAFLHVWQVLPRLHFVLKCERTICSVCESSTAVLQRMEALSRLFAHDIAWNYSELHEALSNEVNVVFVAVLSDARRNYCDLDMHKNVSACKL